MKFTNVKRLLSAAIVMSLGITSANIPVHANQKNNNVLECTDEGLQDISNAQEDYDEAQESYAVCEGESEAEQIVYVPEYTSDTVADLLEDNDSSQLAAGDHADFYGANLTDKEIAAINKQSDEVMVEDNIEFLANDVDACLTDEQLDDLQIKEPDWNLDMVGFKDATVDAKNDVSIAIMDSGVDWLSSVTLEDQVNLVESEQDLTYYMSDMTGHGTAVASIIHSMLPDAKLYSVRVLDSSNRTNLQRIIKGIYWCIDHGIDVINMSFGTLQKSDILEKAIHDAREAGIVVVASAGNEGSKGVDYPGAYDDTIAVGAIDHHAEVAEFSSVGEEVDVVAPGTQIGVETMFGMHTWADGTSMAAPHVTAEVGALIANGEEHDVDFWRGLITETSKSIEGEDTGVIDVEEALRQYDIYSNEYMDECDTKILPENPEIIHVYEDDAVSLEGKWTLESHDELFEKSKDALDANLYLSSDALLAIKRGAVYPDHPKYIGSDGKKHHVFALYWQGQYKTESHDNKLINYIACYKYMTMIAQKCGDTDSIKDTVNGVTNVNSVIKAFEDRIQADKIGNDGKTCEDYSLAIDYKTNNKLCRASDSPSRRKTLKQCFLYGMAIHQATDTFAHSAFDENKKPITHDTKTNDTKDADYKGKCPKRFEDAKAAAQRTISLYIQYKQGKSTGIGSIGTFAPANNNRNGLEGYYLANVKKYAIEVNGGNRKDFNDWFDYINHETTT